MRSLWKLNNGQWSLYLPPNISPTHRSSFTAPFFENISSAEGLFVLISEGENISLEITGIPLGLGDYSPKSDFTLIGVGETVDAAEFWQQDSLDQDDMGNCLWYECSGYTGSPDFHVNNDGVGYMAVTSYGADSDTDPPFSHTLFFKKTEDYGQTWSSDGGYKNSGYYYISDAVLDRLSDSLLTMWSLDPDTYDDHPWYPWAVDSYGDVVGDTINFSDDSS